MTRMNPCFSIVILSLFCGLSAQAQEKKTVSQPAHHLKAGEFIQVKVLSADQHDLWAEQLI